MSRRQSLGVVLLLPLGLDTMSLGGSIVNEPITIHSLDEASAEWIEEEASRRGVEREILVLQLIHEGIDLEQRKAQLPTYHDLDSLAGTWSEEEADEFDRATAFFSQIDEELWR